MVALWRRGVSTDRVCSVAVSGLRDLLGREALRVRAGDRTFRRGEHYTAEGRVSGIWAAYEDRPTLEGFLLLKSHAQRIHAWPAWRARAIDTAREAVVRAQEPGRDRGVGARTPSTRRHHPQRGVDPLLRTA